MLDVNTSQRHHPRPDIELISLVQALKNMRKFPLPFNNGDQTTIVDGIGPTIAKRLTKEMQRRGIGTRS